MNVQELLDDLLLDRAGPPKVKWMVLLKSNKFGEIIQDEGEVVLDWMDNGPQEAVFGVTKERSRCVSPDREWLKCVVVSGIRLPAKADAESLAAAQEYAESVVMEQVERAYGFLSSQIDSAEEAKFSKDLPQYEPARISGRKVVRRRRK